MRRLIQDEEPTHEIVVSVPGVLLGPDEAVFQRPGATINLMAPKWMLIGVPLGIGAGIQLFHIPLGPVLMGVLGLAGLLIAAIGLWRLWAVWRARRWRSLAATRFGGQALDWRLDETEVRQTGPFLDLATPWTAFVHVLDQPAAFVFCLTPTSVLILPRRLLSEAQQADVRELIDRARDRGLIGDTAADLLPSWDLIRDSVRERYGA